MCALLEKMRYSDLLPIVEERGYFRNDGGIKYTMLLIEAIVISMCYSAFYRCDGFYPKKEYAKEILSELVSECTDELYESFVSYIKMVIGRYGIETVKKEESYGENILNVYASRLCEENIFLLARHLVSVVWGKKTSEKGLKNLIHFI